MAILKALADGSSKAVAGDFVVTGGGVFQKTSNGSIPVTNVNGENILKDLVGVASTGSAALVDAAFNMLRTGNMGNKPSPAPQKSVIDQVLDNTQVFESATNYDSFTTPNYDMSSGSSGGFNSTSIFGYAIVGLVLIVIMDKLIGGGK